jgi:alpha-beta hydrolase superfamily lysophospholipase
MSVRGLTRLLRRALAALAYVCVGAVGGLLIVGVLVLENRPDLQPWHLVEFGHEFTAARPVADFAAYLALEDRLFADVDSLVSKQPARERPDLVQRYRRGSLADPQRWPVNWNRSFEFAAPEPAAGVLLLHGMSDSPYSLRALGERLHAAGSWVVGLRLPGHGTAPAGLVDATWEDMAQATRLAMRHLAARNDGRPLYIVGYSTGAALAVEYALSTLQDPSLPPLAGLGLISPAIGVSPVAALAVWQARLGRLLGLDKLAWNSILPEYDPFKYNSFAVNAGDQVHRLTAAIRRQMEALSGSAALERMPPVLALQSAVDATVSAPALVRGLFDHLPPGGHELVLFDINREAGIGSLLEGDPTATITALLDQPGRDYGLTIVTNENPKSLAVVERHYAGGEADAVERGLGLRWPDSVFSLSHVALPFPPDDPLYGDDPDVESPGISLGALDLRGERGVLQISGTDQLRLRWNPFYPYLEKRLLRFVGSNEAYVASTAAAVDCVVLLHGLARTENSMRKLERVARDAGYVVVNQGYPSREAPIETLAEEAVGRALDRCRDADTGQVHFVTHSLGGILVRYFLSRHGLDEIGRVVMLSPPNKGSEAADALKDLELYQWFNGPAGQQLVTGPEGLPARLGPVDYPVGVITGNRQAFFDAWLADLFPGENDGKVSVERAKVAGMTDFLVVPYSHPFIMDADAVIAQALYFLRHGQFEHDPGTPP